MATRRPASSRARVNNNTMPPPQPPQRSKSTSRTPSSQRIGEDQQDSGSSKPLRGTQDDSETHIQVILRCRGRSEREREANSPNIVTIENAKTKELTIETSTPVSSLGLVNRPPTRTYPFDLVFGPEATQSMIYHDVVGPMLSEALLGYNCTLFAYGQTGTGKTYTMQGDLAPTPMGNPSAHAGIIPRALFRLFHELEKAHADFVVKISYVELYNEELRDLLAPDLAAPTTLTQPMGMAAKDAKGAEGGLKIFDDASKRGVFIQGLEEVAVKDSNNALALLTKGSERRQIAATKFNDHSSRSHSVFSITIHIKETNAMGDDLVKVGKLNLVDLAGSENIGRSGAENKRAREAGMINQSLLTLGRVINALVDKASHVPYRESKLTRLLQDSLGGRTKTCIIATISPAQSNHEETLSTLDYALRAKSIKNKPEINQRMTRNSLLKEYVIEIENLKADVLAAREKNGIYFSQDSWNDHVTKDRLMETELVEAKKQVEIIENQMRSVRDEYDQSIALLKRREEEIHQTKKKLEETERTLRERESELERATDAYEQEVVVRQAHQETERKIDVVATGLKNVASQSLHDINGLFEKLDRKQAVLSSNNQIVSDNQKLIHDLTGSLSKKLAEFSQLSHERLSNLESETKKFQSLEQQAVASHAQSINQHFEKVQKLFEQIEENETLENGALDLLKQQVDSFHAAFKSEVTSWTEGFKNASQQLWEKSKAANVGQMNILDQTIAVVCSLLESVSQETQTYLRDERKDLHEMQTLAQTLADKELMHLRRQNELLAQLVVSERSKSEKAKDDLLRRISGMLGDFMQKRDDDLRESIGSLQRSNQEVEKLLASKYEHQSRVHDNVAAKNEELVHELEAIDEEGIEARTSAEKSATKMKELVQLSMDEMRNTVVNSVVTHSHWVHSQTHAMEESANKAFEDYSRANRIRLDAADELCADFEGHHTVQQTFLNSISTQAVRHTSQILFKVAEQGQHTRHYEDASGKNLRSIGQSAFDLVEYGAQADTPSGSTPRKRKWQYNDEWALTRSREDLLTNWNRNRQSGAVDDGECLRQASGSQDGRTVAAPPHRHSEHKHARSVSSLSENETILHPVERAKLELTKVDLPNPEPLVDSRKRNNIPIRSSTRRLR